MKNRPQSLRDILSEGSPRIARLIETAARMSSLTADVRRALPPDLREALASASLRGDTLILIVRSPAWAPRLRFQGGQILTFLASEQGIRASQVKVKVRPP